MQVVPDGAQHWICDGDGLQRRLPQQSRSLVQVVSPENFASAVTWSTGAFQLACIVGPAVGGVLMLAIGLGLLDLKRIRVANFLPGLIIAPVLVELVHRVVG